MVKRLQKSPSGPFVEVGGGSTALSTLWWVDPGTTVPEADRTGAIAAPYASIQAAITAGEGDSITCFSLTPANHIGNLVAASDLNLCGYQFGGPIGRTSDVEGNIECNNLSLQSLQYGGDITAQSLSAAGVYFVGGNINLSSTVCQLTSCRFFNIVPTMITFTSDPGTVQVDSFTKAQMDLASTSVVNGTIVVLSGT